MSSFILLCVWAHKTPFRNNSTRGVYEVPQVIISCSNEINADICCKYLYDDRKSIDQVKVDLSLFRLASAYIM